MKKTALFSLSALMFAGSACAASDMPFYEGVGIGAVDYDLHLTDAERHLPFTNASGQPISSDTYRFDTSSTGYQVFAGYRFNPYVALELTLAKLGTMHRDGTFNVTGAGSLNGTLVSTTRFQPRGVGLSVLGIWPVNKSVDLFARAGLFDWTIKAPYTIVSNGQLALEDNPSDSGNDPFFGIGGAYKWGDYSLRLEYQRFTFSRPFKAANDTDASMFSASFLYNF